MSSFNPFKDFIVNRAFLKLTTAKTYFCLGVIIFKQFNVFAIRSTPLFAPEGGSCVLSCRAVLFYAVFCKFIDILFGYIIRSFLTLNHYNAKIFNIFCYYFNNIFLHANDIICFKPIDWALSIC